MADFINNDVFVPELSLVVREAAAHLVRCHVHLDFKILWGGDTSPTYL
jgi:hypothetical protein